MKLDLAPRGAGKTERALAWLCADPGHRAIITHSEQAADHLRYVATKRLQDAGRSATAVVLGPERALAVSRKREVYIDNVDLVLRNLFGRVVAVSATGEA